MPCRNAKAERYRGYVRDCRALARQAESAEERELLLKIAHHWEAVAEILERYRPRDSDGPTS